MKHIKILINAKDPDSRAIRLDLEDHLKNLETIEYRRIKHPVPAGELGLETVVGYVIENYDKIIVLITALIKIISMTLAQYKSRQKKKVKKHAEVIVIMMIDNNRLVFPVSKKKKMQFLKKLKAL